MFKSLSNQLMAIPLFIMIKIFIIYIDINILD